MHSPFQRIQRVTGVGLPFNDLSQFALCLTNALTPSILQSLSASEHSFGKMRL